MISDYYDRFSMFVYANKDQLYGMWRGALSALIYHWAFMNRYPGWKGYFFSFVLTMVLFICAIAVENGVPRHFNKDTDDILELSEDEEDSEECRVFDDGEFIIHPLTRARWRKLKTVSE